MLANSNILKDQFGRQHTYLRISLTEKCNLRCTYCMPANGIPLTPKSNLMTANEVFDIAKLFVENGVNKIRLTGGEPLVRKDFLKIVTQLKKLNTEIAITTNGVLLDRYLKELNQLNINNITVSLDTLQKEKFTSITRRNDFDKVWNNIIELSKISDQVKINVVLLKGVNDHEINDFIKLTQNHNFKIRFIEFMPFDGNEWDTSKLISQDFILNTINKEFNNNVVKLEDDKNDTSRNFKINGFTGSFAIISSVTNPFCDTCNRIRLTADGKIKNCLFSNSETELLNELRKGNDIENLIQQSILSKKKYRGGMNTLQKLSDPNIHRNNRSMIAIGG